MCSIIFYVGQGYGNFFFVVVVYVGVGFIDVSHFNNYGGRSGYKGFIIYYLCIVNREMLGGGMKLYIYRCIYYVLMVSFKFRII